MQENDYLGLDVGLSRTGIARASVHAKLAEPLKTVSTDSLVEELIKMTDEKKVSGVIVGLPRSLNGDDTDQTRWVRDWVEKAKNQLDVPYHFQDEALTTKLVEQKAPNHAEPDAVAAAIILQDFLDEKED